MKTNSAALTAILAWALAGCASHSTPPRAERFVAPAPGTTWAVARRDTGSYGSGDKVLDFKVGQQTWQGSAVYTADGPEGSTWFTSDGNWIGFYREGKPVLSWDPPIGFRYPLEVGRGWTQSYRVTNHATQQVTPMDVKATVESYEDITLPAGKIKAFKVRWSESTGNENVFWYSPELNLLVKQHLVRTDKQRADALGHRAQRHPFEHCGRVGRPCGVAPALEAG